MTPAATPSRRSRIPLALKLALTGFIVVFVAAYWMEYGPTNFLFLCDVALFVTLAAIWWESPLLASAAAVGILVPQTLWILDFLGELAGFRLFGITPYMFNPNNPLSTRLASAYHLWLPCLLVWTVSRLGYDRRALWLWTVVAWVVLAVSYFWMPPPPRSLDDPTRPVNINFVYGFGPEPQQWMSQGLYFALIMVAAPVLVFYPAHLILSWTMRDATQVAGTRTVEENGAER